MFSHSSCFELISVTNQSMLSNQAMLIFPHFHAFLVYRVQARILIYFPGENQFHSSDVFYITWRQLSLQVVFLLPYQLQWFQWKIQSPNQDQLINAASFFRKPSTSFPHIANESWHLSHVTKSEIIPTSLELLRIPTSSNTHHSKWCGCN